MANEWLKLIRKSLGMTQQQLAQRLGIGKAALSMIETGKATLTTRNKNILVQELNVNPEFLDSGREPMFNAEPDLTAYRHRTDNSLPLQSVPLYSIEGTAGLVPLFADRAETKPVNYIHIPNLPKCDGAIYVVGDSMYPLLKSGDIVLYKQLSDIADIFWGDMYLLSIDIDGEEYITVKYIQKSDREGFVKLVSQNPHHADKEVAMSRIRAIALVKASIRMNSIRRPRRTTQPRGGRAMLCAPEFVCDRAYSNTSSGASGRYGPSFASKITAGSNTVRLCHCPAGISTPYAPLRGSRRKRSVSRPRSS